MSFELPSHRKEIAVHGRWPGAAFLVEAMLLLVFVMACLGVLTQMFAASSEKANQGKDLTDAVAAASAVAESFAADPAGTPLESWRGHMHVICDVQPEQRGGGILYHAEISVYEDGQDAPTGVDGQDRLVDAGPQDAPRPPGEALYSITTAKYESGA